MNQTDKIAGIINLGEDPQSIVSVSDLPNKTDVLRVVGEIRDNPEFRPIKRQKNSEIKNVVVEKEKKINPYENYMFDINEQKDRIYSVSDESVIHVPKEIRQKYYTTYFNDIITPIDRNEYSNIETKHKYKIHNKKPVDKIDELVEFLPQEKTEKLPSFLNI